MVDTNRKEDDGVVRKVAAGNMNEPNHVKPTTKVGNDHLGITSLDKEGEVSMKNEVPSSLNTNLHDATVVVDESLTRFGELHLVLTMNPSKVIGIDEGEVSMKNEVPSSLNTNLHDATVVVDESLTRFGELHLVLTMNPMSLVHVTSAKVIKALTTARPTRFGHRSPTAPSRSTRHLQPTLFRIGQELPAKQPAEPPPPAETPLAEPPPPAETPPAEPPLVETRPPMLEKGMYDSLKTHIMLYIQGKENGEMLRDSVEHDPYKFKSEITVKDTDGVTDICREERLEDLKGDDKLCYDSDIKAVNILFLGLSVDIYTLINHYQTAKEIWDRVKELMEGTKMTKQER
nr:hypothetical protein [Tanacetum cinerariifolium]